MFLFLSKSRILILIIRNAIIFLRYADIKNCYGLMQSTQNTVWFLIILVSYLKIFRLKIHIPMLPKSQTKL
ncbi:hypothetical protein D7Z94_04500 [Ulvibacterium marinum]|uniref:Uncharacterized protein n=1 Tax=Ulvibacterium marinum TaxID=2419782 RepID=A0A3B0C9L4_9FLAO|nr:hypothetical protein D7Z94_04500 [Ulvibacterium marinum]